MLLYAVIHRLIRPLAVAMLSVLLAGSGCTARDSLPASVTETAAVSAPEGFLLAELGDEAIYRGDLILVNNDTPYHFPEEPLLQRVAEGKTGSYFIRSTELLLAPAALEAVNALLDDFLAQGGSKTVNLVAAWRSEETQQRLFERSAERSGLIHAESYVARPGGSEHHTGLAVDFSLYFPDGSSADFTGEGEYAWITENAPRYGLIVRYHEEKESLTGIAYEPWHFRYIGVPHAIAVSDLGMCLEEYLEYLRTFPYEGEHLFLSWEGERYEVWFEEGSDVHLPIEGDYAVSGNNRDGVIVTRKLLDDASPGE